MVSLAIEITALIFSSLFIPLMIYGNYKTFQKRNETYIQKRTLWTLFGLNGTLILQMSSIFGMILTVTNFSDPIQLCSYIYWFLGLWSFLCFMNLKTWLIFFKYKWTKSSMELKWQKLINPSIESSSKSNINLWFIRHHKTYGNIHYVSKIFIIYHIMGFIVCSSGLAYITLNDYAWPQIIYGGIPCALILNPAILFYVVIVCKTPYFDDVFSIHWESKMYAKLLLVLAAVYCLTDAVFLTTWDLKIIAVYILPLHCIVLYAMHHVSTFTIHTKNSLNAIKNGLEAVINHQSSPSNIDGRITLKLVLGHKDSIHLFLTHLSRELSQIKVTPIS